MARADIRAPGGRPSIERGSGRAPSKRPSRGSGMSTGPAAGPGKPGAASTRRKTKFQMGDRVHVKDGAPQAYRGQIGVIAETGERGRYGVQFDSGVIVPLYSWWLEGQ